MTKRWFNFDTTKEKGFRKVLSKLPFNRINVETLTGTKSLTTSDKLNQHLDSNGTARIVNLPSTDLSSGDLFIIKNTADYNDPSYLQIKEGSTVIDQIYSGNSKTFIYDGTNWVSNDGSAGSANDNSLNTAFGKNAGAYNKANAFGYYSEAQKENSFAKGNYALATRHGEETAMFSSAQLAKRIENHWYGVTGDDNWTEIFLDGSSAQLTMLPNSSMSLDILFVARTCDAPVPDLARYRLQLVATRVTSGNVAVAWQNVNSDYESDATWDVRAAADTVNQAVKIEVKGAIAKTVFWYAVLQPSPEIICDS